MKTFRLLVNRVNRERNICRAKYYEAKDGHLKDCKPSLWWKEVKKLSGMTPASEKRSNPTKHLQHLLGTPNMSELADTINDAFLSPLSDLSPLPPDFELEQDSSASSEPTPLYVSTCAVYKKLSSLNFTRAQGPDNILAWLLKQNADLLSCPVSDILNCSYNEGRLPPSWKTADIVSIPKKKPPKDIKKIYGQYR